MKQFLTTLQSVSGRLGIYNLKGVCKGAKVIVDHGEKALLPGVFVWDLTLSEPSDMVVHTAFVSLHVVVWAKPWNSHGRDLGRSLVKFRPSTPEEFALETVMNE